MDKLFLLDGMALIYRAYYALIRSPIYTSRGFNTSAIFGFTNTVLELVEKRGATHLATAFDTSAPTARHQEFPAYKAQREEMPEELSASIPYVKRLLEAFHIPVLTLDGYEADDIIGTLTLMAESVSSDTEIYMVTPDKDFAQLVSDRTKIFKPGRQGSDAEILDLEAICHNWQVESPSQIIDILGLWGDASDNIPGVPGIGEKTAKKLIAQFGSVETLLGSTDQLKGKQKENVINHKEQALLSKRLVTIDRAVPLQSLTVPREGRNLPLFDADGQLDLTPFALQSRDDERLKDLCVQFEFNTLGKRLFGKDFKEGRGHLKAIAPGEDPDAIPEVVELKKLEDVRHDYAHATTAAQRDALFEALSEQKAFAFDMETSALDPRTAQAIGIAFSWEGGTGTYVPLPTDHHQR
ncbi:MAG: 5'-3' exonuclease H3TH domain-containing protein, partial [Verrucomicrobiota bacterium]